MNLTLSIQLKATRIVTTEQQKIDAVSVADKTIGFVCINSADNSATAFNSDGRINDSHCPGCAVKALFAWETGLDEEAVEITGQEVRVNPASLILSAILSSAVTKQ